MSAVSDSKLPNRERQDWKKFWRALRVFPLWFIMPITAFFELQKILSDEPKTPTNPSDDTLTKTKH